MPLRSPTARRRGTGEVRLDDLTISEQLDLLAGGDVGEPNCRWKNWQQLFADYVPMRDDFAARFPRRLDEPPIWAERMYDRWQANPADPIFTETRADRLARQSAEFRAWWTDQADEDLPQDGHGAALGGHAGDEREVPHA